MVVFYIDMFEIVYGIESGIVIQFVVVVVFFVYFEMIQKIGDCMVCLEMFVDGMFFYVVVRVGGSGCVMIDFDVGYRIQFDERMVVFIFMIVGIFYQCILWENVVYFQIGIDWCMQVIQYGFVLGGIGKSFYCFFFVYSCLYRVFVFMGFYVLL